MNVLSAPFDQQTNTLNVLNWLPFGYLVDATRLAVWHMLFSKMGDQFGYQGSCMDVTSVIRNYKIILTAVSYKCF